MENKTALVIGATGLIGARLTEVLLQDGSWSRIRLLVRRPLDVAHPQVDVAVIDFGDKESFRAGMAGADAVFCAVGTTTGKVKGDQSIYRQIDYEIPFDAARFALEDGCRCFALVSSVGASAVSRNFYLRLKGETEDAIQGLGYPAFLVFRPSLLLGKRRESRPAEWLAQQLMPLISFLLPARLRPVSAKIVAKAMVEATKQNLKGSHIFHYKEIRDLADAAPGSRMSS